MRLSHGPEGGDAVRGFGNPPGRSIFQRPELPTPDAVRLGSGAPGPAYWQQRTDYEIDVEIIPSRNRVEAVERVTYHNNSPHRLEYLWVQLEQNLWNKSSKGARATGSYGEVPGRPTFEGGYEIRSLRSGGVDLEHAVHDTLMRVELASPLGPGERLSFELAFAFDIPPYRKRMGYEDVEGGMIVELAQWFPHVCKYDDVRGWNTTDYLGPSEFYTDFGDYEIRVTVPRGWVAVATGELQNAEAVLTASERANLAAATRSEEPMYVIGPGEAARRPSGPGKATWHYRARDVRTAAVAASDAFVWDAAGVEVPAGDGRPARRVVVQSLYPLEAHESKGGSWSPGASSRGSTRALAHAVKFYSGFWSPYPYPVMTNVNGPEDGMEYPMMVFCGSRRGDPFGVTDHEVGHTWFPMMVNTDERSYEWQDEGFNTFGNFYSAAAWRGTEPSTAGRNAGLVRVMGQTNAQGINIASSWHFPRWEGTLNYTKTGVGLFLLRELVMGHERFDRAFKDYIRRWSFKSPQPADWLRTMEDAGGMDLSWFWNGWIQGSGVLDFAALGAQGAEDGVSAYVTLEAVGEVVFPLPYRVTFDDGSTADHELPVEAWASSRRFKAVIDAGGRRVVGVQVDPRGLFPDVDLENNVWGEPAAAQ